MFRLPLVRIVETYVAFRPPSAGTKPTLLLTIGSQQEFKWACYGVAVSPLDNSIWVTSMKQVQAFNSEGKFLRHVAKGQFQFEDAEGIAFSANGDAYIAEPYAGCIVACRSDGSFLRRIDIPRGGGEKPPEPYYLVIDSNKELLFVTERGNNRVAVLKLDGSFVRQFGSQGSGDGQFNGPRGIALGAAGEVAVADCHNHRIQVCCRSLVVARGGC